MRHIYLFIALFLLTGIAGYGQTGAIKGRITTTDGQAATGIMVALKSHRVGATSNAAGVYIIGQLKGGTYTIVIDGSGIQAVERTVQVADHDTAIVDIVLAESAQQLDEVVVASHKSTNDAPVAIGRAGIAPKDLPQSVAVIGQATIKEQQAQRLSDIVRNVNGVYLASTRGAIQENFSARGYSFSSTNMFKDGARVNTGAMPEVSGLEKVEILKGSAAILYGNVSPGGVINMITKQPKFEQGGEVSMRIGSYGLYKPAVDVYGPVNKWLAYRVNGTFETAKSYRDVSPSKRYYINPSLLIKPGKNTEILVQADYLKHDFTPDFGIGTYNNTLIPDVPISTFYGAGWQYAHTTQTSATASIKHRINEAWTLNASASYQQYDRDYYSTEKIAAAANGDWARNLNKTKTHEEYYIAQAFVTGKLKTGGIGHTILAGMDADRYYTQTTAYNQPAIYDTINLFDPNKFTARTDIPDAKELKLVSTPTNRYGAYVQDLVSISDKVKVLAGIRWSYQDARPVDTLIYATDAHRQAATNKVDKAFSPRIGLVYKPVPATALFASYSNSFSVNTGTDVYGNALAPSIIDQYEAGIKNDFLHGALSASLTAYHIINNNLAQTALYAADGITPNSNTNLKALTGQTASDGAELDIVCHPLKGLDILAGYSYNYIRYTHTPDAKGNYVEGERLINNPASTGNGSVFYTLQCGDLKGLKFGASVFYTGTRYAGFNDTKEQNLSYSRIFEVGGFTTVDISAGYTYNRVSLILKVSNLTNTINYYVHENYSINPIPPRQAIGTIAYRF